MRFKIPLVFLLLLFITCVPVLVHAIAHKGYEDSIRESALKADSESEIPCQKVSVEYMYVHEQN